MINAQEVANFATGILYACKYGSTILPGVDSALPSDSIDLGYIDADGIEFNETINTWNKNAYQNGDEVIEGIESTEMTITFKLIQMNKDNMEFIFGGEVNATSKAYHRNLGKARGYQAFVFDGVDAASGKEARWYFPKVKVSEIKQSAIVHNDIISWEVTLKAFPIDVAGEKAHYTLSLSEDVPATSDD